MEISNNVLTKRWQIENINKPYFMTCSVDSYVSYSTDFVYYNSPVNMNLCKSIEKTKINNENYIKFIGCDVVWRLPSVEERDKEFERILELLK